MPLLLTAIAFPTSSPVPPRKVEYTGAEPSEFSFVTNASRLPPSVACTAPAVVGKFVENVPPVTCALPAASTAIPRPTSEPLPPRYVPYRSVAPVGRSEEHTSELQSLRHLVCR